MIVNVELFDKNPLENVMTCLNYRIDRIIYFGYGRMMEEKGKCVERFLKKKCHVREVEFCPVLKDDLRGILKTISGCIEREKAAGNQVFFDLTGGADLILAAFGILAGEHRFSVHTYDVFKNEMREYGSKGAALLSETAKAQEVKLDLDDFISLYGGVINYRMHKDFKANLDRESERDVVSTWKLFEKYHTKWVHYAALFRKYIPDEKLAVTVPEKTLIGELKKSRRIANVGVFHRFLDDCRNAGLLLDVSRNDGVYHFRYKNPTVRNYFWDSGSILEMYTFLLESQKENCSDCRVGVHIDWDGQMNGSQGIDVLNEIDIMSISNNIPTFISCKIGNVDQMALYELEAVANRFGGKYARKVLAVARDVSPGHMQRAREMGIEIRKISSKES